MRYYLKYLVSGELEVGCTLCPFWRTCPNVHTEVSRNCEFYSHKPFGEYEVKK